MQAPIEVLLADSAWLRRLTLQLARDPAGAADLQQDVAMAALQTGPGTVGRPWFVAVARRLWALRLRRSRREASRLARLQPAASSPDTADVVADAELQRRAVEAVLALPPHYRDTILLRFLRGLSVEATAQRLGVGVDTVRTRQKRALRRLRLQLSPQPGRSARIGVPLGGILMLMNKSSLAAAAALVLLALCGWWLWPHDPTPPPAGPTPPPLAAASGATPESAPGAAAPQARELQEAPATHPAVEVAAARPVPVPPRRGPTGDILVTVVDAAGKPACEGKPVLCRASAGPGDVHVSDAASLVRFQDLPVGTYLVGTADLRQRLQRAEVVAGGTTQLTVKVSSGARIAGRVVDADGHPVPFAAICARPGSWPSWPFPLGRADGAGMFDVAGVGPLQTLLATDPKLGTSAGRLLREGDLAQDPPTVVELRFAHKELGAVRGRVVDAAGAPVLRAWVQLNPTPPALAMLCATDAEGRFTAAGIPPGRCRLYVCAKGLAPHTRHLQVDVGEGAEVEVVLDSGATVRGVVRDGRGQPLAGAYVQADGRSYPQRYHQQTDAQGRFTFDDVAVGTCRIAAWQKQLPKTWREVAIVGPGEHEVEIVLVMGDGIRGRLLDAGGQPLANWYVERAGSGRWTATDADGRFVCVECNREGNELRVRPNRPGQQVHAAFLDLHAGPDEQLLVVGADRMPNAIVRGTVLDAGGRPVAGAQLQLGQYDVTWRLQVRTQADGSFELGPLPPGSYQLQPLQDGLGWSAVPFELRAWQQLQLDPFTARR